MSDNIVVWYRTFDGKSHRKVYASKPEAARAYQDLYGKATVKQLILSLNGKVVRARSRRNPNEGFSP